MKKLLKILSVVAIVAVVCACFVACIPSGANNNADNDASDNASNNVNKAEALTYVSLRINPEIELVIDADGLVVAVNAINADGETVLVDLDLIGMSAGEAAEAFTAKATELGFVDLDTEGTIVYVMVDGEDQGLNQEIEEEITNNVNDYLGQNGIFGKVEKEDLAEYEALAEEWGISLAEVKIIHRILQMYPEMTAEEVLNMPFGDVLKLVKEYKEEVGFPNKIQHEYKEAIEELKEEYFEMFELSKEIEKLTNDLSIETLTEEEIAFINAKIAELQAEYDEEYAEYQEEIEEIKAEFDKTVEEITAEIEKTANDLKDQFKDKWEEYEDHYHNNKDKIDQGIKDWRDNWGKHDFDNWYGDWRNEWHDDWYDRYDDWYEDFEDDWYNGDRDHGHGHYPEYPEWEEDWEDWYVDCECGEEDCDCFEDWVEDWFEDFEDEWYVDCECGEEDCDCYEDLFEEWEEDLFEEWEIVCDCGEEDCDCLEEWFEEWFDYCDCEQEDCNCFEEWFGKDEDQNADVPAEDTNANEGTMEGDAGAIEGNEGDTTTEGTTEGATEETPAEEVPASEENTHRKR